MMCSLLSAPSTSTSSASACVEYDESDGEGRYFWDDTSGEVLNPNLTRDARAEEVEAIRAIGVYRKVLISQSSG